MTGILINDKTTQVAVAINDFNQINYSSLSNYQFLSKKFKSFNWKEFNFKLIFTQ